MPLRGNPGCSPHHGFRREAPNPSFDRCVHATNRQNAPTIGPLARALPSAAVAIALPLGNVPTAQREDSAMKQVATATLAGAFIAGFALVPTMAVSQEVTLRVHSFLPPV